MRYRAILLCAIVLPFFSALRPVQAQTPAFDLLYSFTATNGTEFTNIDGADSQAGLVLSGGTLYGTTYAGGAAGNGTIFSINTNGSALTFSNLHSFTATNGPQAVNNDGANPIAGMILSGNMLYGTTQNGGTGGSGSVFRINTDGTGFTNLYSFTANSGSPFYANSDGAYPAAGLVISGNTLYGATQNGGGGGVGTLFSINTDGTHYTNLHSFAATSGSPDYTNTDGAYPGGTLVLSGKTLYGTTESAGPTGNGTVFKVNTDTTGFTNLHNFSYTSSAYPYTNNDGAVPLAGVALSGNSLYGTTYYGGTGGVGTIFGVHTDGTGFSNLHSFSPTNGPNSTNIDGAQPVAGLLAVGNTLFGTAGLGGNGGNGTVFSVNTSGSGFMTLYDFTATSANFPFSNGDGADPLGAVVLSGTTVYSTTAGGGNTGDGTVFALGNLTVPVTIGPALPILQIALIGNDDDIVFWPTSVSNYLLQTKSSLTSGIWSNITTGITIVGTNYVYTNALGGQTAFFRLEQGPSTALPPLAIAPAGNQAVLSWPAWASNFVLQTETNLAAGNWSNITSGISTVGTNFVFTAPLTGQSAFFRLQQE